ncbi:MAG: DUF5103 domain-containing protein, partial [Chitinophagaceae bacterium]|nr:DUF5103 domain-containing protein [Chitinophagaceae bacterium]
MKYFFLFFLSSSFLFSHAQTVTPDAVYMNIKSIKLYSQNNQQSAPILNLNSSDLMELHFDDLDGYVKNYSYTFQLCNADWTEVDLSPFDYIKGFTQNRLSQYRVSSIALTNYVHYQALLPDRGCVPSKSGNYLLKVFLNGNVNQLAFTKRFFVVENRAAIGAQVLQPFNNELFRTHQRLQFSVNATQLNPVNPQQQVKVVVQQNHRWDNALTNLVPAFIRGNVLEYNGEQDCLFPAGKEYRWADLRSFRYQSERIESVDKTVQPNDIFLKPDPVRIPMRYIFYKDYNGWLEISTTESINPFLQGDYANVHFTFVPANNQPYPDKEIFLSGELTNNQLGDSAKMKYNATKGVYEKTLFLKQGYYSYTYLTKDLNNKKAIADAAQTDGNYWETENEYTIFVYYRSLSGRHDELVGVTSINSRNGR